MSKTLRQRLASGEILISDGATGTMLQSMGLPPGQIPDAWNLENPEAVLALERAYVVAGSQIILTNSFSSNYFRLARHGLGEGVAEVNRCAAELARQVADEHSGQVFVAGSMGPTGEMMEPLGRLTYEEAVAAFAAQARALADGGVDAILIETMSDLQEARAAIEGVRQSTDLPLFCTMSFDTRRHTMMGVSPRQMVEALAPLGLDVLGANCGHSLADMEAVIRDIVVAKPGLPIWAKPNAGLPEVVKGQTIYRTTPQEMADSARRLADLGARIIGGCCGSTPEHIAAMAAAVRRGCE